MAYATPTTPTSDFIDNGDGTVTHKKTGLIWQRCAVGQTWSGGGCTGTASTVTYDAALKLTSNFAGKSDWRLPNIAELQTIVERENSKPEITINTTIFPDTPNIGFWSSSPYVGNVGNASWGIGFGEGFISYYSHDNGFAIRLVRGGQPFDSLPLTTPTKDFVDNGNGTVTHKRTGLMWKQCAEGQTRTHSSCAGTASTVTYDDALKQTSDFAGYSDWRLPTLAELSSIVEYGKVNPAINGTIFPNTLSYINRFWSSSPFIRLNNSAWVVDFNDGFGIYRRGESYAVRLVRGNWSSTNSSSPTDTTAANVVLLLHGMNSDTATWNSLVSRYFAGNCPSINSNGISTTATSNAQKSYCYRLQFGRFDAGSKDKGLEDAWAFNQSIGRETAGDYSSFNELGVEVNSAIGRIKQTLPNAKILLIGHSRGGLAARAFLQHAAFTVNKANVVGLVTTGTPHKGTRLGRFYDYLQTHRREDSPTDWQPVDFLRGEAGCNALADWIYGIEFHMDARRPTIGYLADNSPMLRQLNAKISQLPAIKYGYLAYDGVYLGKLDPSYNLFEEKDQTYNVCGQVSYIAEAAIKGGTATNRTPSTNYLGDGIVTKGSQAPLTLPANVTYVHNGLNILHADEPAQTGHIAQVSCQLGFPWLTVCNDDTRSRKQSKTPLKTAALESHDYDALTALNAAQLWQDWLVVMTDDSQTTARKRLEVALGLKLRSSDNATLIAEMKQHMTASPLEAARVAMLLAEIATPSALEILTDALLQADLASSQTAISNAIIHVADSLPENPHRADLSAVLENAWLSAMTASPSRTGSHENTLATAIAKLGTARGVELLLTAIEKTGEKLPFSQRKPKNQAERLASAAFSAMDNIINPDSKAVLSDAFNSHRANEAVFIAAGNGLVNLGSETAAQLVMQRIDELPDSAEAIAQQWLNSLSGKVAKATLRRIGEKAKPRKRVLRKQLEELVR